MALPFLATLHNCSSVYTGGGDLIGAKRLLWDLEGRCQLGLPPCCGKAAPSVPPLHCQCLPMHLAQVSTALHNYLLKGIAWLMPQFTLHSGGSTEGKSAQWGQVNCNNAASIHLQFCSQRKDHYPNTDHHTNQRLNCPKAWPQSTANINSETVSSKWWMLHCRLLLHLNQPTTASNLRIWASASSRTESQSSKEGRRYIQQFQVEKTAGANASLTPQLRIHWSSSHLSHLDIFSSGVVTQIFHFSFQPSARASKSGQEGGKIHQENSAAKSSGH